MMTGMEVGKKVYFLQSVVVWLFTGVTLPVFEHYQEGGDSKFVFFLIWCVINKLY